jgi:hypothetical protein
MPDTKKISQKDVDRMMAEGESEYRSTLPTRYAKERAQKMKEKEAKQPPQPPRKKTSKSLTINGEPDGR